MKKYSLVIITEHQNSIEKAKKVADLISDILDSKKDYIISKYDKFEHSFRIVFHVEISTTRPIESSIEITDRLCSPWTITYDREAHNAELIFNKTEYSTFRKIEFNVIKWAAFEIEND